MAYEDHKGLSEQEVERQRQLYGLNTFETDKGHRFLEVLKEIVTEPIFIILVCTSVIYFILSQFREGIVMLVTIVFVSGISLFQVNKSRKAVDTLKKLSQPRVNVRRGGRQQEIGTEELVPGDVILLEDGNSVPADALILEMHDLSVNESVLTGESLSVFKGQEEQLFQGTLISTGSCIALVTATGKNTELGKIGQSMQAIENVKTPLQLQINHFVRQMVIAGVIAFFIVWGINFYTSGSLLHGLLHGLTIAMSVLPEEIPVAFSTFMALGAYHLYKKKVIARSPHTVETLGAATVICADKTGTITENAMQLSVIYDYAEDRYYDYTSGTAPFNTVLEYAMWASEVQPFDNMERSIHEAYAASCETDQRPAFEFFHEYPLSGSPPIMTHVYRHEEEPGIIACKGGVEGILAQSDLSGTEKERMRKKTSELASKGYRVLAVARSSQDILQLPASQHEFVFEFLGLVAFYDPPKKNMQDTLQQLYHAGIELKMITGDYAETAGAIAQQIGMKNSAHVLSGTEVMQMPATALQQAVKSVNVFARMFPDAKLKVIKALKANGEVVAMTGDGVNDGPALKAAHIGVAMGLRGSETAKEAASLILMDDDLSHLVKAVALGRRIYENLKKAIRYIISIHIPIILIVSLPMLLFWKFTDFFSPVHVIFLEIIMGPTCSIVYENEPMEADSMNRPPHQMTAKFFSLRELTLSIIQGLVITFACLGLGYYYMQTGATIDFVRSMIYTTLIFSNLILTITNRSFLYSAFTTIRYRNRLMPLILSISLSVLLLSIYVEPFRNIFELVCLGVPDILICLATAFLAVSWVEFYKLAKRKKISSLAKA